MMDVKLRTKLICGFLLTVVITVVVGVSGWIGISKLDENINELMSNTVPSLQLLSKTRLNLEAIRVSQRTLLSPYLDQEIRDRQFSNFAKAREEYLKAFSEYKKLPLEQEERKLALELESVIGEWREVNNVFLKLAHDLEGMGIVAPISLERDIVMLREVHGSLLHKCLALILLNEEFTGGEDPNICSFGKWLSNQHVRNPEFDKLVDELKPIHNKLHFAVKEIKSINSNNQNLALQMYKNEMVSLSNEVKERLEKLLEFSGKAKSIYDQMIKIAFTSVREKQFAALDSIDKLLEYNQNRITKTITHNIDESQYYYYAIGIATLLGVLLSIVISIILATVITKPIKNVIIGLGHIIEQVRVASHHIEDATQSLAESSSEQAASLEETTASVEEISSKVTSTSDNTSRSNTLMQEINSAVKDSNRRIAELVSSMNKIQKATVDTQNIIKTIDNIAFQTNLLALNAAIEAARAGDQGLGFATVADQVRQLALQSTQAAKNTDQLISSSISSVESGTKLILQSQSEFNNIENLIESISILLSNITDSLIEQSTNIKQVTNSISELDNLTQSNAINAEGTSESVSELASQIDKLKEYAIQLSILVNGSNT